MTNILDLDTTDTINKYEYIFNVNYPTDAIYKLIELIGTMSSQPKKIYIDYIEYYTTDFLIKYLNKHLMLTCQYSTNRDIATIILYNKDKSITYLKLKFSTIDDPFILFVKNDYSDNLPKEMDLGGGEFLINLSHRICRFIGYTQVRLDDDSYLTKADPPMKLWLYLRLTKGYGWYEKFGYEPINNIIEVKELIEKYGSIKLSDIKIELEKVIQEKNKLSHRLVNHSSSIIQIINNANIDATIKSYVSNKNINTSSIFLSMLNDSVFNKSPLTGINFIWYDLYINAYIKQLQHINRNISYVKII